ncbi:MAG TPA: hypothetical protein VJ110_03880 [Candidatus Nanoarchaeia archaeon]|nr:hypothetical protein [Candidatus Nanoarchaeia archaeon]
MDKRIRTIIFVLFIALIVASSGCLGKPKESKLPSDAAFVGGTSGVGIEFLPDQPPSVVFASQPFQISVKVENKGEGYLRDLRTLPSTISTTPTADAVYGYVSIAGVDPARFGLQEVQELRDFLTPVTKIGADLIPGGQTQLVFPATAPSITGAAATFPLQVIILYSYTSEAVAGVCLKENLYQQTLSGTEICKLTGTKPVESAGAPVKVTSVDELPTGFNIRIKNTGGGYPFIFRAGDPSTFPQTEGKIDRFNQRDRVRIASVILGETELRCSPPDDPVHGGKSLFLVNNEASFFCPATLGVGREFVDQLTINLEYGYVERAVTEIEVQSIF